MTNEERTMTMIVTILIVRLFDAPVCTNQNEQRLLNSNIPDALHSRERETLQDFPTERLSCIFSLQGVLVPASQCTQSFGYSR